MYLGVLRLDARKPALLQGVSEKCASKVSKSGLGRSEAGRVYRRMERYGSDHPGTFVFSRLIYTDNSWVPSFLEYGVLMPDGKLWVEWFEN